MKNVFFNNLLLVLLWLGRIELLSLFSKWLLGDAVAGKWKWASDKAILLIVVGVGLIKLIALLCVKWSEGFMPGKLSYGASDVVSNYVFMDFRVQVLPNARQFAYKLFGHLTTDEEFSF